MDAPAVRARVKSYTVLYTTQLHAKLKKWHDGSLRVHHHNSRTFLLDADGQELRATFLSLQPGQNSLRLEDGFLLKEGEQSVLDATHLVEIVEFESETTTNLSAIDSVNKAAREIAKSNVKAWAVDFDHESPLPRSKTSSNAPRASTSQVRVPDVKAGVGEGKSTGAYKGFGIPTPRSYELAKRALEDKASKVESRLAWQKRNNGSGEADVGGSTVGHDASSKVMARASPYPTVNYGGGGAWKRPPPDRRTSTPSRAGPSRDPIGSSVTPIPLSKQLRSTPRLSQTKAASSQFKPPSFTTPPAALAGRGAPRSGQGLSVIGATRRGDGRTTGDVKDSARAKLEQEWIRFDSDQRDREMD